MQIENNIPVSQYMQWKADLNRMKVNQSAQIAMAHYNTVKAAISVHFNGRNSKIFTTNKESDEHFRVWRLK